MLYRCPQCSAAVRPDAPWCTLCYLDLRAPASDPASAPAAGPASAPAAGPASDPEADPVGLPTPRHARAGDDPAWPCTDCGAQNPMTLAACAACGAQFLAALRLPAATGSGRPLAERLAALSRGRRYLLAATAALLVSGLVGVLSLVL